MGIFTGCSGSAKKVSTETGSDVTAAKSQVTANDENNMTGQVTAIDGNNLTLSLYSGQGMRNGSGRPGGNGSQESRQENNGPDNSREEGSTQKDGEPDMTPPKTDEIIPDGKQEAPSSDTVPKDANTSEGEEKVITISENTQINIEDGDSTKTGTVDDIKVGCMLSITYTKDDAGNEVISSVTVRNFSGNSRGQSRSNRGRSADSFTADGNE